MRLFREKLQNSPPKVHALFCTHQVIKNIIIITTTCLISTLIDLHIFNKQFAHCYEQRRSTTNLLISNLNARLGQNLLFTEQETTTTTTTTTSAPLIQQDVPSFVEPIGNHTVAVGRDAQLSCKINKLGSFRTAWLRVGDKGILTIHNNVITRNYRFGLLIADDEKNFILTIKNVQPSDKGGYMCQINSIPMRYEVGYLDVLTPPVFDDIPKPTDGDQSSSSSSDSSTDSQVASTNGSIATVTEGSSATLTCQARGHPSPTITWRREDNRPIVLRTSDNVDEQQEVHEVKGPTLIFNSANKLNSGAYLCIASNGVQPAASKRQVLDVQYSPIITLPQAELAGHMGQQEAQLECLVDLNPIGSFHWIKLATSTTNTDRRPVVTNQEDDLWLIEHDELTQGDKFDIVMRQISSEKVQMILTIKNVVKQDFSWYKCIARNSLGLQSSFIRFYETSSSSFSLNNVFRGGSSSSSNKNVQQDNRLDTQLNDEQADLNRQQQQRAAHTRSSWIQRSVSGGGSPRADGSSSSASKFRPTSIMIVFSLLIALFYQSTIINHVDLVA